MIGMLFKAKNEHKQYLTSINPIYAKYTEGLWAEEVSSSAQLESQSCMHMVDIYDRNVSSFSKSAPLVMLILS